MPEWSEMVLVGRVVRPHGNRGRVVVQPETDFADERFRPADVVFREAQGAPRPLTVIDGRAHDGRWVVGFAGVETIDDAEALRGVELRIPAEAVHALGPGAFYAHDLVGCAVTTADGAPVGRVERVELATGVPLLVVTPSDGQGEVLVPFTEAICRRVDVREKTIAIEPPDGLIDLNRRPQGR